MSEYEEEMLLKELQKCGLHLRKLKEKLYCYCEKKSLCKRSTILKMYAKIPSLTVRKAKIAVSLCGYWAAAIFAVVTGLVFYSFPLLFFLNISHFTFVMN